MIKFIFGIACLLCCATALAQGAIVYAAPDQGPHFSSAKSLLAGFLSQVASNLNDGKTSGLIAFGLGPNVSDCGDAALLVGLQDGLFYVPATRYRADFPADKHEESFKVTSSNKCVIHVKLTLERPQ